MAGEWREYRIGEISDIIGGSTPSTADPSNFNGEIPWLTPKDLSGPHERYVSRGERNLSRKGLEGCSAQLLPAGTVLLTSRAPIGYVAIAKTLIATNQGFRNLVPKSGFSSEFLYYWLKAHVAELQRHASGSTFQELSGSALAEIKIRVPPLPEQRAIAHILGTLDDKIELNRRMSETLEQMAQALFKSWFVDFDPVVVNALRAGNPLPEKFAERAAHYRENPDALGLPDPILRLFPARFVDSELGEIPEGWEVKRLCEVADVNWGDTNVTKQSYVTDGYKAFSAKGPDGYLPYYDYDKTGVVLSAIGENSGNTWIIFGKWSCIKNTIRFWSTDPGISTEYLFLYTYGKEKWPRRGSAQPFISQTDARNTKILIPNCQLARLFGDMTRSLFLRIEKNEHESRTLAALRDTLLPRLISGELRVKDAERFPKERG